MKRILWTITAVGALAVPVGMAAAQAGDDTTVDPETPTTVVEEPLQLRQQTRMQDGTGDHDPGQTRMQDGTGAHDPGQTRMQAGNRADEPVQQRLQTQDCEECDHLQIREQAGYEQGQGDMVRNQVREQLDGVPADDCDQARVRARAEDGQGTMEQQQLDEGVDPTTEPAEEQVEDGSGDEVRVGQDTRQYREQDREPAGAGAGR